MPYKVVVERGPASKLSGSLLWSCCLNTEPQQRNSNKCTSCHQCKAYKPRTGRRCKNRTCLDSDYCWYHLKNPFKESPGDQESVVIGVEIKESRHHGKGLFATRSIPAGQPIMQLKYETITRKQFKQRYQYVEEERTRKGSGPFTLALGDRQQGIADSICHRNAPSYANDPRNSRRTANAEHAIADDGTLWMFAKRRIPVGTEILVDYGDSYWRGAKWIQFKLKQSR